MFKEDTVEGNAGVARYIYMCIYIRIFSQNILFEELVNHGAETKSKA